MSAAQDSARTIRVDRTIAAPAAEVWALISDVTRMGDWSPESTGAAWVGGADGPSVGARFKGMNAHGSKSWSSDCTVTACDPGRRFAFDVKALGMKVAGWAYEFETVDGGCTVTEIWDDHRGPIIRNVGPLVTGTKDRVARNRETMAQTLEALAAKAEAS